MIVSDNELEHYGILRKSGRYPWGSGKDDVSRATAFLSYVDDLRKKGVSEKDIAAGLGTNENPFSSTNLRQTKTIARNVKRAADEAEVQRLKAKGMGNTAIARQMGVNESSVRSLLNPSTKANQDILQTTTEVLRKQVDEKKYVDVGLGNEALLGISKEKFGAAKALLKDEGYREYYVKVEQAGMPGKFTTVKTLVPPNTTYSELYKNRFSIQPVQSWSEDGGRTFKEIVPPKSLDSSRIVVRYGPDGGSKMDGVIELRPGVGELSMGESRYAQVRIMVDGTHYLKGMAVYSNDLPKGVDVRFNTNKDDTGNKLDSMKKIKDDPENPFGSTTRQRYYLDSNGKEQLSVLNNVGSKPGSYEEGGWEGWSRNLSSQMLSKQTPALAKQQLMQRLAEHKAEYEDIKSLTNPVVKAKLLQTFADRLDSGVSDLKAAALPRQGNFVILPAPFMKEHEIYAPKYNNGEKLVLIRHPHGGVFEIPELTVNNRNLKAKALFGNLQDAVGIHPKAAQKLSGADFDGDTVVAIPNNKKLIKTSASLEGLKNFDPVTRYPGYEGMKKLEGKSKQREMGEVSNLITDMTIRRAPEHEIAAAVRHSMVVIDAEKHNLNYKQSAIDNNIKSLRQKYQPKEDGGYGGASTLISRAGSQARVLDRTLRKASEGGPYDPETGKKVYTPTGETFLKRRVLKDGTVRETTEYRMGKSTKLAEVEDAKDLIVGRGSTMERVYAEHANQVKALANDVRKSYLGVPNAEYDPQAAKTYAKEVGALQAKYNTALKAKPLERTAQLLANAEIEAKRRASPGIGGDDLKKVRNQAIAKARLRLSTNKEATRIEITPREWQAIQAGAISHTRLKHLLDLTDLDVIRKYAMPREKVGLSGAKASRARLMLARGYTQAEVATALGISTSTLSSSLK